jgi:hypothetical protein
MDEPSRPCGFFRRREWPGVWIQEEDRRSGIGDHGSKTVAASVPLQSVPGASPAFEAFLAFEALAK